jgi:transposase
VTEGRGGGAAETPRGAPETGGRLVTWLRGDYSGQRKTMDLNTGRRQARLGYQKRNYRCSRPGFVQHTRAGLWGSAMLDRYDR